MFARSDGSPWNEDDWRNWRKRRFADAAEAAKVEIGRPYDLRHSAASLWLQEGVSAVQVAAWIGNRPSMTTDTYAHVIAEFDPADRKPAADVITAARTYLGHRLMSNAGNRSPSSVRTVGPETA